MLEAWVNPSSVLKTYLCVISLFSAKWNNIFKHFVLKVAPFSKKVIFQGSSKNRNVQDFKISDFQLRTTNSHPFNSYFLHQVER